jgi:hypothetical protein
MQGDNVAATLFLRAVASDVVVRFVGGDAVATIRVRGSHASALDAHPLGAVA